MQREVGRPAHNGMESSWSRSSSNGRRSPGRWDLGSSWDQSLQFHRSQTGEGSIELQRHTPRAAHLTGRPGYDTVQLEVGDTPQPLLKSDLQLHAGEIGTDAAVNAETKRGMPIFLAVDHDLVGIGDEAGITIGSRERKQNHLAGAEAAAPEDGVVLDLARHRHRRIGTQELLDRGRDQGWLGHQTRAICRDAGEMPEGSANGTPGGVDARNQ